MCWEKIGDLEEVISEVNLPSYSYRYFTIGIYHFYLEDMERLIHVFQVEVILNDVCRIMMEGPWR